jgi:hypothetical protein
MTTSTMSLKDHHPIHRSADPPSRPPRRKDRIRKSMLTLDAIEEDQNKYDLPPREDEPETTAFRQMSQEPTVPMPGTGRKLQRATSVLEDHISGRARCRNSKPVFSSPLMLRQIRLGYLSLASFTA